MATIGADPSPVCGPLRSVSRVQCLTFRIQFQPTIPLTVLIFLGSMRNSLPQQPYTSDCRRRPTNLPS